METLKLIPQVFFDLLARVVPGCVGLVSYFVLTGKPWNDIISYLFGASFVQDSSTLSFLIFLGTGFVVGEIISPAAKWVQRINEGKIPKSIKEYKEARIEDKLKKLSLKKDEYRFSKDKLRYDRLRFEKSEIGALCAKIRAEFTMHNSLAVVFAIDAFYYPFSVISFHWYILFLFIVLTIITANRGRSTNDTFNETVAKFVQILNEKESDSQNKPHYTVKKQD
jgi:hypothetical protein